VEKALKDDWKGPEFDSRFTSSEAVEAICKMTSQSIRGDKSSTQCSTEPLRGKVGIEGSPCAQLLHDLYALEGDCRFCREEQYGIEEDYHQQAHQHFRLLHQETSHGLIFKHYPLLRLSGVTANQLNEYGTMFFNHLGNGLINANFWSSVPQHLLDETGKHIRLAFQGFLYKSKFKIAPSSENHQRVHEALCAFDTLKIPNQQIWRELLESDTEKQKVPSFCFFHCLLTFCGDHRTLVSVLESSLLQRTLKKRVRRSLLLTMTLMMPMRT